MINFRVDFVFLYLISVPLIVSSETWNTNEDTNNTSILVLLLCQNYESRDAAINDTLASWKLQLQQQKKLQFSDVLISHEVFTDIETKSIVPMLPKLLKSYEAVNWFVLVKPYTELNIEPLTNLLLQYQDPRAHPYFLGHSLYDEHFTIIHHYAPSGPHSLLYPLDCAGFALSYQVLKRVSNHWTKFNPAFTIDPFYEFSLFLKHMNYPSPTELHPSPPPAHHEGVLLTHLPQFCSRGSHDFCVTSCKESQGHCLAKAAVSDVFFAIKTCQKFHKERIPIQRSTWLAQTNGLRVQYYSDVLDKNYETASVGVPNTDTGHCSKLLRILHLSAVDNDFKWLVIADDDTLLSVPRLLSFLGCHDNTESVILGEMYGHQVTNSNGYLYPTAGSGVVFSRLAVEKILSSKLLCPSPDYPDDMFLGILTKVLNISMFDSSLFHQNQPQSYHPQLLSLKKPISFHRLSPEDPIDVFHNFLSNDKSYSKPKIEL